MTQVDSQGLEFLDAAGKGNEKKIQDYLDQDFPVDFQNHKQQTALHLAAVMGYDHLVTILADRGANLNAKSKLGFTPLHYACKEGQFHCAKVLIDKGANVDATADLGFTPLYIAAQGNFADLVKLLLQHGADHRKPLRVGRFIPLHIAQQQGHEKIVQILSQAG